MTSTGDPGVSGEAGDHGDPGVSGEAGTPGRSKIGRRQAVGALFRGLVEAIQNNDDARVEDAVLALSQRSRWLAPLAFLVSAFVMLFQGVKLLFVNWRLTLVQVLPAMWIWLVMLDFKVHIVHDRGFRQFRGATVLILVLVVMAITAAAFFLNATFAFAVAAGSRPDIRQGFAEARRHRLAVVGWGLVVGALLAFATVVVDRWGRSWFALALGIALAVLMYSYVAIPSRLLGLQSSTSRRDAMSSAAIAGTVSAVVCSPAYVLGRIAILMLGSHTLRTLAIVILLVAVVLQAGATSAIKAIKMSAKIVAGTVTEVD